MIQFADIEICTHCNARCLVCPVSQSPKQSQSMSNEVFEKIVSRLASYRLKWASLSHYNEPLLDSHFLDKVEILSKNSIPLRLYTNGILLFPEISQTLARLHATDCLVLNIPSADPEEYRFWMGVRMSPLLLENVRTALQLGLRIHICVNGLPPEVFQRKDFLAKTIGDWPSNRCNVYANFPHSRAGILQNRYTRAKERWDGKLGGCSRIQEHIHINVEGKVFLCCQDYDQRHIVGDILRQNPEEILSGEKARCYHSQIMGHTQSSDDFICRYCIELKRL